MNPRLLPCLAVLFVSCDKAGNDAPPAADGAPARIAKTARPGKAPSAASEPAAKLAAAKAIGDPAARTKAIVAAAWETAELAPAMAADALDGIPAGSPERAPLLDSISTRFASADSAAAAEWAGQLPDAAERSAAMGNIAQVVAETDPRRAARLLSDAGTPGRELDVATVQVIRTWAKKSPQDAAEWVAGFQPGEARERGFAEIATTWTDADPAAATAWISSLRDPALRQEAEDGMAEAILARPEFLRDGLLEQTTPEVRAKYGKLAAEAESEAK
jgi:hypothetical protein